jgi:hypothetical protein
MRTNNCQSAEQQQSATTQRLPVKQRCVVELRLVMKASLARNPIRLATASIGQLVITLAHVYAAIRGCVAVFVGQRGAKKVLMSDRLPVVDTNAGAQCE